MPATGRDLTRRSLLAASAAAFARAADPAAEVWDVVGQMAAALGRASDRQRQTAYEGEFLAFCDPALPGFETLRANLRALIATAEIQSGVDQLANTGDDRARDVEADWTLQLVSRSALERVTRRREVVKLRFEKRGKKWKVVRLDPVALFAPLS